VFDDSKLTSDLISVSQITNEKNCDVLFTDKKVIAIDRATKGETIIGRKKKAEKLWQSANTQEIKLDSMNQTQANLAIQCVTDAEYVQFSSKCFGNPPVSTLISACQNGWLSNYPRLTAKMIRKNPPNSPATSDGHLNRHRQNVQSTNPKRKRSNKHAVSIKTYCTSDDNLHCDATGRFPIEAEDGSNYVVVAVYKNYIHAVTMPDRSAGSYRVAYEKIFEYFKIHDANINMIILDNETSSLVESYFESVNVAFQYVPPRDHRANRADCAIQSFKNHLISSLSTVSQNFPMKRWPQLMTQVLLTLNHLRPWSADNSISAYEGLHKCKFDFNKNQLRPVGTYAKVFIDPNERGTWAPHGEDSIYLHPAMNHYRCWNFLILSTEKTRVSNTADFFINLPSHDTAYDSVENQRVSSNTGNDESPELTAPHVLAPPNKASLRKQKDADEKADGSVQYRSLTTAEKKKPSIVKYKRKLNRRWRDTDTDECFYISDIVMPDIEKGTGSSTPHFKFCNVEELNLQNLSRKYEYTRCSEITSTKYVLWIDSISASVVTKEPRSTKRELNLTDSGKPITMGYVLTSSNKEYWEEARVEEFCRLLDSNTIKHVFKDSIPREHRKNISYYNERPREKPKLIEEQEHIECRVRGTFGGDHRKYPGAVSSNTAEYPVVKILLNSVISDVRNKDPFTRFASIDLVDFYIGTELENHNDPDYFKIKAS
jgi:hypothetical protein